MDTLKLNTLGLTKAEAQNELSYALLGRTVSQFKNGNKEYNIVLDSDIDSREQIQDFKVKSSISGKKYAVNQFANVDLNPKITTIRQNTREIGRIAADELISAIENPRATIVKRVVVDAELIEGETIKRIGN